ncbi:hypothetical protein M9458_012557, partial [Cirrhinus mrigala]
FQRKTPKPVGQPEVDLPDPEESCFPDLVAPKPEPEMDLVGIKQPCIPEPKGNLVASPEPKLDLVDPQKSCVNQTESTKEMKIKKIPGFIVTKRSEYSTMRTVKKIPSFVQNDTLKPFKVPAWYEMEYKNIPESKEKPDQREWNLVDSFEIIPKTAGILIRDPEEDLDSPSENEWDLDDSEEPCSPGPNNLEPHPKEDLKGPPKHDWGVVDWDLVGIEQPCIPEPEGNLVASPEPKLDLVDPQKSRVSQTESTKEMIIKKIPGFIVTKRAEYSTIRTVKKIPSFIQNDTLKPFRVPAWYEMKDQNFPESKEKPDEREWNLVDSFEIIPKTAGILIRDPEEDLDSSSENEWDLDDSEEPCSPGPNNLEPHPKEDLKGLPKRDWGVVDWDLVGIKQPCILKPEGNLVDSSQPKLDLVDPQKSTKEMIIKKIPGFIVTKRAEYSTMRTVKKIPSFIQNDTLKPFRVPAWYEMKDQNFPESKEKPDEREWNLVDSFEIIPKTAGILIRDPEEDLDSSSENEWDLDDSEEPCSPGPNNLEPHPKEDLKGLPKRDWGVVEWDLVSKPCIHEPEMNLVASPEHKLSPKPKNDGPKPVRVPAWPETHLNIPDFKKSPDKRKWDLVDSVKPYPPIPSVPKPDLHDSVEWWVPGPSVPKLYPEEDLDDPPEREWGVVDSVELYRTPWRNIRDSESEEESVDSEVSYVPGPSDSEPRPEWDLAAPEEPFAPSPGVSDPVTAELLRLENYIPQNVFQLENRLKRCTLRRPRHVSRVWPRIYIGDEELAKDRDELSDMCITHILNAAAPKKGLKYFLGKTFVNTGSKFYRGMGINYCGMPTTDRHCSDISKYFREAAKFIRRALKKRANQVLICCKHGDNHSASLVLAYLMIYHDMTLEEAIDHVITFRRIRPSRDFLEKLMLLNVELVEQRKLKLQDLKA